MSWSLFILLISLIGLYVEGVIFAIMVSYLITQSIWRRILFVVSWPLSLPVGLVKLARQFSPLLSMLGIPGIN